MSETREQAIAHGALLGAREAASRSEDATYTADRIQRAKSYAAWEYDGKPLGRGHEYAEEFGYTHPNMIFSGARPAKKPK